MINTTLCYIEQDDKYLLLHRVKKKNDINKDKWIGIGGKFEGRDRAFACAPEIPRNRHLYQRRNAGDRIHAPVYRDRICRKHQGM